MIFKVKKTAWRRLTKKTGTSAAVSRRDGGTVYLLSLKPCEYFINKKGTVKPSQGVV